MTTNVRVEVVVFTRPGGKREAKYRMTCLRCGAVLLLGKSAVISEAGEDYPSPEKCPGCGADWS